MPQWKTAVIREAFLNFFQKNDHNVMSSSPLIPQNDPSLMFTNSGMVQFKNWFTGLEPPLHKRVATSQKCIRAGGKHNDLDNVGYTRRHHTFFEMLGNFSFGDYFKEQAIVLAWEFITEILCVDKNKLYITVYHEDAASYELWRRVTGFSSERIIRISEKAENFWSMGDTGPCGPCSEIFFDHGAEYAGGLPGTPDSDGDRYMELWNLVFMQYEQLSSGELRKLQNPAIDTGMGLERIAAVLQGVSSNFETDIFHALILASKNLIGDHESINHKVIADHIRAIAFMIADGVLPSNDGPGYVLRRIIRRAVRYKPNKQQVVLHKLLPTLIEQMGDEYPELQRASTAISTVLQNEEAQFTETLLRGIHLLEDNISRLSANKELPGEIAFKLYDTYGFPLDLTKDILRQRGLSLDENTFKTEMAAQKARSKWTGSGEVAQQELWFQLSAKLGATEFLGYAATVANARILAIIKDSQEVNKLEANEIGLVILDRTPFYGESGGQVGDTGNIFQGMVSAEVLDTKIYEKLYVHTVKATQSLCVGMNVEAVTDQERRKRIMANHSSTHLLHKALRKVLGDHVIQKGSLVTNDKLRFDFAHFEALSTNTTKEIESLVNAEIIENHEVCTKLMKAESAVASGAMALFGEKYQGEVRVVSMSESVELCGGTHVKNTGDIGLFKIISESSVAAGVRRIEAVTGLIALNHCNVKIDLLKGCCEAIKTSEATVLSKIKDLQIERANLAKALSTASAKLAIQTEVSTVELSGVKIAYGICNSALLNDMIPLADAIGKKFAATVIIIALQTADLYKVLVKVNKNPAFSARVILEKMFLELGGSGGGNDLIAQGTKVAIKAPNDLLLYFTEPN